MGWFAGSSVNAVAPVDTVPNCSNISHLPSSSSTDLSRLSGSLGSRLFLPAPRESLLRHAGEDCPSLDSLWDAVNQIANDATPALHLPSDKALCVTLHDGSLNTTSEQHEDNSTSQGYADDDVKALLMSGLAPQSPESSKKGQEQELHDLHIHHALDASPQDQVKSEHRTPQKTAQEGGANSLQFAQPTVDTSGVQVELPLPTATRSGIQVAVLDCQDSSSQVCFSCLYDAIAFSGTRVHYNSCCILTSFWSTIVPDDFSNP